MKLYQEAPGGKAGTMSTGSLGWEVSYGGGDIHKINTSHTRQG